jgi:hypothetical protein
VADSVDKAVARIAIRKALGRLTEEQLAVMLCACYGHPPVVKMVLFDAHCARCGLVVGNALTMNAEAVAMVGHDCPHCTTIFNNLTEEQRLLVQLKP